MDSETIQELKKQAEQLSIANLIKTIEVLSEVLERKTNG